MSDEIIKVLDNLGQKFGIAIDWTGENVVPYLKDLGQRFITYKTLTAILTIAVCIAIIILGIIAIKKLLKWRRSDQYDDFCDDGLFYIGMVIAICAIIGFALGIICNIEGIIQNMCMPELTIIEYLKSMITQGG